MTEFILGLAGAIVPTLCLFLSFLKYRMEIRRECAAAQAESKECKIGLDDAIEKITALQDELRSTGVIA